MHGSRKGYREKVVRNEDCTMEIILLQDVKTLGKKGDIVKVNEGYARNFILPKKLGMEANAKNLNDLKLQKKQEEKLAKQKLDEAIELGKIIESKEVTVRLKTGEGGKIFGAVSTKEIAEAAKSQCALDIDKKKMGLKESIKSLGVYEVPVKLHKDVTAKLKVKVVEG